MAVLTFSALDQKYPSWANLVQNAKIISLGWNLVASLILARTIQWCCSRFSFLTGNTFFGKFDLKIQSCQFKVKFDNYNQFHNILRLSDVIPNFPFTTSETMGDYYL